MTAEALLSGVAQAVFVLLFVLVFHRALEEPRSVHRRAAAFFTIPMILIVISWANQILEIDEDSAPTALTVVSSALLLSWPYALLLLAASFTGVHRAVVGIAAFCLAASIGGLVIWQGEPPAGGVLGIVVYFAVTVGYAAVKFTVAARASRGLPRKRLRAAAVGSAFLVMLILSLVPVSADPDGPWTALASLSSMAAAVSYYIAFTPPAFLRDAWLAGDVRRFVTESVIPSPEAGANVPLLINGLEANASRIVGAPVALVVADRHTLALESPTSRHPEWPDPANPETTVMAQSFQYQRAIFDDDPVRHDPANADMYRAYGARGIMAVPMSLSERRLGVLATVLDRPTLFAEDDLRLLTVLADRLAVVLQSREALRESAEMEADRAALQLKDEFLAAVAHDLKTPLTTVLGQAQLLSRRALRDPGLDVHHESIVSMVTASQRMQRLVDDLLDAARADQIGFIGTTESVELLELVREAAHGFGGQAQRIRVDGHPTSVTADRQRIVQVATNLLDNALKYSPFGSVVDVHVHAVGSSAYLSITDRGSGIPPADLPIIFGRFRRGSKSREQRPSGLGLGLYICRRIAEEHGGAITVSSKPGEGSTFTLTLPREPHEGVTERLQRNVGAG